jgi:integrase
MRRQAIAQLNVSDVDQRKKDLTVVEKGGLQHTYEISKEGLDAIADYLKHERKGDDRHWRSPVLFLPAANVASGAAKRGALTLSFAAKRPAAQCALVASDLVGGVAAMRARRVPRLGLRGDGRRALRARPQSAGWR